MSNRGEIIESYQEVLNDTRRRLLGENINLLSELEWRIVHNALSYQQSTFMQRKDQANVDKLQQLMDKVRDNYIVPYDKEPIS